MITIWVRSFVLSSVTDVNLFCAEMALNIDTVVGHAEEHCSEKLATSVSSYVKSKETFVIDGLYCFIYCDCGV